MNWKLLTRRPKEFGPFPYYEMRLFIGCYITGLFIELVLMLLGVDMKWSVLPW